ncbi:hypothetical protein C2845_PM03G28490 [Panicum miliaceum]|uniref:Uncharacterized protein n=1 Tax=Panicum miliaceum TaxID=4540 RepID=A0A3L6TAY2_PANMI|nr:hypothetical protein C2845_PM03G28490 [Panicum miliaceum]
MGDSIDLNMVPDDDLGGVDDLLNAAVGFEADQENVAPDIQNAEVFDEGEHSDDSVGNVALVLPDLNDNLQHVEVFIPPIQIMPDEIQEHELMNNSPVPSEPSDEPMQDQHPEQQHDMQLGFVELFQPVVDPVFASLPKLGSHLGPETIRHWAKHFFPGTGSPTFSVPQEWSPFFAAMLLNPGNFTWAKQFMESAAWEFLSQTNGPALPFALPQSCPSVKRRILFQILPLRPQMLPMLRLQATAVPSSKSLQVQVPGLRSSFAQAGKLKVSEEDPDLRSARRKEKTRGFKNPSCADKGCISCKPEPPVLSSTVIRNLGESFYKVDPTKLTDKVLLKKKKPSAPGSKKALPKKKADDKDVNDDAHSKKKPKK